MKNPSQKDFQEGAHSIVYELRMLAEGVRLAGQTVHKQREKHGDAAPAIFSPRTPDECKLILEASLVHVRNLMDCALCSGCKEGDDVFLNCFAQCAGINWMNHESRHLHEFWNSKGDGRLSLRQAVNKKLQHITTKRINRDWPLGEMALQILKTYGKFLKKLESQSGECLQWFNDGLNEELGSKGHNIRDQIKVWKTQIKNSGGAAIFGNTAGQGTMFHLKTYGA